MEHRQALRRSLRLALERDELFVEYQPIVEDSVVGGFEALLRWRHPKLGLIPPVTFIPLAESAGLMTEIGQWVLERACRDAMTWPEHQTVSVNLSAAQFLSTGLTDEISQTLDLAGLPAERLVLEITESVLLERSVNNLDILNTFKLMGIRIALDDFGTEYSSLSYLKNFPFDTIKIDKYFIDDIETDPNSQTIVQFVISLAHGLGMSVTAEGVENEAQAKWLRKRGCDRLQGYFFGRPLAASAVSDFNASFLLRDVRPKRQRRA
jgi:EAL domain-containing protein (putative c-di-GMP-specific phosphodiesterase class I)